MATKMTKTQQKARQTTHSDLAKKYGPARFAHARDMVRAEEGVKRLTKPAQWAAAVEIAKIAKRRHEAVSLYKVDKVAKRTKKEGTEPGYYTKLKKSSTR